MPRRVRTSSRVALIGHTAGSAVAINLAALAKTEGLPTPKLVFLVMPGGIASDPKARGVQLADLSQVDAATMLITMIGDREFRAADAAARRLLRETTEVPQNRKIFMRVLSDDHGFPTLSATLASPGSVKEAFDGAKIRVAPDPPVDPKAQRQAKPKWSPDMVLSGEQSVLVSQLAGNASDTLDHMGYWKTFDMAAAAAFAGRDAQALRNDPNLTDMGRWSDGWPVKRLGVADAPRAEAPGSREGRSRAGQDACAAQTPVMGIPSSGGEGRTRGPGRVTPVQDKAEAVSPRPVAAGRRRPSPSRGGLLRWFGHRSLSLTVVSWPGRLAGP